MSNKDTVIEIVKNRTHVVLVSGTTLTKLADMTEDSLDLEIAAAVRDYSQDEPRVILEDHVPGDLTDIGGVKFFLLDKWDSDVSDAGEVEIEHPVDQSYKTRLYRGEDEDYDVEERPSGYGAAREAWLKFYSAPTGTPGTWRLRYRAAWENLDTDADLSGLSARAVDLAGLLAAVYVARAISAKFGKTSDATISADVVDYRSKASEWGSIAKTLFTEYEERIDRPSAVKRSGQDVLLVDRDLTVGRSDRRGADYLVHRRSRR